MHESDFCVCQWVPVFKNARLQQLYTGLYEFYLLKKDASLTKWKAHLSHSRSILFVPLFGNSHGLSLAIVIAHLFFPNYWLR